jgi:hypothetical protein
VGRSDSKEREREREREGVSERRKGGGDEEEVVEEIGWMSVYLVQHVSCGLLSPCACVLRSFRVVHFVDRWLLLLGQYCYCLWRSQC